MNISILTPSFNYGRFIRDALDSVAFQGSVCAEHVVVDGGSKDETTSILRSAEPRVRWISEPDEGQSDALSKAVRLAEGDWIGWLNADEFYLPGALEAVADLIERCPGVDVVYADCVLVDSNGCVIRLLSEHRFNPFILRHCNYIPSCTAFVRRSAVPDRYWDSQCRSMMDWDFFLEICRRGSRFQYLPRATAAFRVHSEQVTARPWAHSPEEFQLIRNRHGIPSSPGALLTGRTVAQLGHGILKIAARSYWRQWVTNLTYRGVNIRWFATPTASANAWGLIEKAYPRLTGSASQRQASI